MDDDNQLNPLIASSCIFLEDKTSEKQVEGIIEEIESLKNRLKRLREVLEESCPRELDFLPLDDQIDISKFGHEGVITTETCNSAQKTRRILDKK